MRIAVTGSTGFIGRHLADHLKSRGHQTVALTRTEDGTGFANLPEVLEDVAAVIHLAARQVDSPATPLVDYLPSNVVLTEKLATAAAEHGVDRFVLASSRLTYPSWINGPVAEDCPYPPDGFYGLSKRIAESVVGIYANRSAMSAVALRIGQVFGKGDGGRGVLPRFIEAARNGQSPTITGEGAAVRDFVYVGDVVRAFELAAISPIRAPAINIGGGGHSIRDMALAVCAAAGLDPATITSTPVEQEDTTHYNLDCTLAATELGWRPQGELVDAIRIRLAEDS